jgi:spore coat polysaccharide biosynthesis predicted glycosyltransferase SpsG
MSSMFVTGLGESARWLRSRGETVVEITADPGAPEDAEALARLALDPEVAWIVTDGYVFREDYLRRLAPTGVPVASIDDLAAWFFPSALVINGGFGARDLRYRTSPATRLLLGPKYLLLREGFCHPRQPLRPVVRCVFVCFGGADPEDRTGQLLDAWRELESPPTLEVLAGAAYAHLGLLLERASRVDARVHCDLDGGAIVELMDACDLAIVSAGMVACELVARGVPLVLAIASEDQRSNALALAAAGAAVLPEPSTAVGLLAAARRLIDEPHRRHALARSASGLIDGLGASRLAATMMEGV